MPAAKRAAPRRARVDSDRLKAYLSAAKNESVLLGAVDRHLQLLPNDRDTTVIHPSEMSQADWCPRATWLRLIGKTKKPEPLTLRSSLIFEEGHQIHTKWQGWLKDMGVLWGRWVCRVCNLEFFGWSNELPSKCKGYASIGIHQWKYKEVPLSLDSHRIAGHADGVVAPGYDESFLLEIKSVGPGTLRILNLMDPDEDDELSSTRFSKITRPAKSHFMQTQIYLRLLENWVDEVGTVSRAVVVYEHKADQQPREFVLTRNDRWTDPVFETALDIVWAIDKGREVRCPNGGCAKCSAYEEE